MRIFILATAAPLLLYAWALTHPEACRALVAELQRRWRLHIIQKYGKLAAQDAIVWLRKKADKEELDKEIVEELIKSHKEEIIRRLGTKEANKRLGEPTPLERYH